MDESRPVCAIDWFFISSPAICKAVNRPFNSSPVSWDMVWNPREEESCEVEISELHPKASAIASRSAIICSANAFWEAFNSADSLTVRSKTPSPSLSDFAAQSLYKASILARYLFATRFSKMAFFKYSPKSSAISLLLLFISERVETKLS